MNMATTISLIVNSLSKDLEQGFSYYLKKEYVAVLHLLNYIISQTMLINGYIIGIYGLRI
jgi:hypothetical protein